MIPLILLSLVATAAASRSVISSIPGQEVNLVEYFKDQVLHGRCSFVDQNGQKHLLFYEEVGDQLTARSATGAGDPVASVRECKNIAVNSQTKSAAPTLKSESAEEAQKRLIALKQELVESQDFLDPSSRFLWPNIDVNALSNLFPKFSGTDTYHVPFPTVGLSSFPVNVPRLDFSSIRRPSFGVYFPKVQVQPLRLVLDKPQDITLPIPKPYLNFHRRDASQYSHQQAQPFNPYYYVPRVAREHDDD